MATPGAVEVLVVGGGPAALAIATALAEEGVNIGVLSAASLSTPWTNTYGIWGEEVDALGLAHLLSHRWSHTVSYFGTGSDQAEAKANQPTNHGRDYGLFDKQKLQQHWLAQLKGANVSCWIDHANGISHGPQTSAVHRAGGGELEARLVIDATGHKPAFVKSTPQQRRPESPVAGQAAYGVVGRFSRPPIETDQFVFMDYRSHHLSDQQRQEPPSFLYAMHLGGDDYFVEETSLALAPALPFEVLKQRLEQRLMRRGSTLTDVIHEEYCLFPMNPALPDLHQRVVGFGGSAGMVHPASGYMVGSVLRRAPELAKTISDLLQQNSLAGEELAQQTWQALWPPDRRLKREFFRFGLNKLMGFDEQRLRHHFHTFFTLPDHDWYGFLTNTLTPAELTMAMVRLFALAPWDVRAGLLFPAQAAPGLPVPLPSMPLPCPIDQQTNGRG